MLRNLDIEELGRRWQAEIVDVEQQFARKAEPLVDVEALVEIGVVDEPLPADGRARLLEVGAHDHDQVIGITRGQARQPFAILERRRRVVDGARARRSRPAAGPVPSARWQSPRAMPRRRWRPVR